MLKDLAMMAFRTALHLWEWFRSCTTERIAFIDVQ